jgi:DNA-binding NtrC family response regulator
MLEDRLQANDYGTIIAGDGVQALEQVEKDAPNLMLLDLDMPRLGGLDVLKRLPTLKQAEDIPVIVMTAHGSVQAAVDAMKEGAYDFLTKPLDKDHLLFVIGKALERDSLKRQVACLKSEVDSRYASIVGTSAKIRAVLEAAQRAAKSDASVLLLGESGTGKELFARSIHQWSPRQAMPLVVINCVALTEALLENELFGHERGAFTGAVERKLGRLEMAGAGTIVLDEVAALSMSIQAKLLRVLEERRFERLGGTETLSIDARLIALTNADLQRAVSARRFREDLYFRLSVLAIHVPALRERRPDIAPLAEHILARLAVIHGRDGVALSDTVRRALESYDWPGNVRELKNALERALIFGKNAALTPEDLPDSIRSADSGSETGLRSIEEIEREAIEKTLEGTHYKITRAAEILGISRKTLLDKRKKYGLQ